MIYLTSLAIIVYLSSVFFGKQVIGIGQILLIIPISYSLYYNYKSKSLSLPTSAYWLLAFILAALMSLWINTDLVNSLGRQYYLLRAPLIGILGIYLFRYWVNESTDSVKKWTLNLALVGVLISCIFGLYQYSILFGKFNYTPTSELPRISSYIYTMKLGYGLAYLICILIPVIIHKDEFKNFLSLKLALFALAIFSITCLLTFTRGAVLGIICSLPITLYFYNKKLSRYFAIFAFIFVAFTGIYYFFGSQNTSFRFIITKDNPSDNLRRSVWLSGLYAIKERPLTGWGYSNLKPHMHKMKEKYDIPAKHYNSHSHNNFIEVGAGAGVIGLFIFIGWIISWIRESFYLNRKQKIIIFPFIAVFLILGQFEVTLDYLLAIVLFSMYALSVHTLNQKKLKTTQP